MTRMKAVACSILQRARLGLAIASIAAPAAAFELQLGLGHDGMPFRGGADGFAASIAAVSSPLARVGPFDLRAGVALEADDRRDAWAGLGPVLHWSLAPEWRLGASVMAGSYSFGEGHDLGSGLQFKSAIDISRRLGDGPWRGGLALEHKSNAGFGDSNPGVETLLFTVAREI